MNKGAIEKVDIIDILEFKLGAFAPGYSLAIDTNSNILTRQKEANENSDVIAFTDHNTKTIYVSEQLYENAYSGDSWSRILLAHELGHAVLHSDFSSRTSHFSFKYNSTVVSIDESKIRGIPLFRDSERQADVFAAFFMSPDHIVDTYQSAKLLSAAATVPLDICSARLKYRVDERVKMYPTLSLRVRD